MRWAWWRQAPGGLVVDLTGDTDHAERDAQVSYGTVRVYVRSP
jgi:hypothetical protein